MLSKHRIRPQTFWKVDHNVGAVPTPLLSHRFSWFRLSLVSPILIAIVLIGIVAFPSMRQLLPWIRPQNTIPAIQPQNDITYGPPPYAMAIQNSDPSLQDVDQHLQKDFSAVYGQLVNRFAFDPVNAPQLVIVDFAPDFSPPASLNGTTITLSSDWVKQHPNDRGLLTHELAVMLEHYPSAVPGWFADGLADYARDVYGPADDDWSLPDRVQPQESYRQGGAVTARFLLWLEQYTRLDIVDQLNHALQTKQPFASTFHRLTHHTVDELWNKYKGYPVITLLPDQLYKTVTSRKPIYQSSFRVQDSTSGTYSFVLASGLYLSNFAMQADMTIIHGNGGGFIFRMNNQDNTQERLRVSPDGTYDLVNRTKILASGFSSAIKQGLNQLTVIVQKHTFYVYINSHFITQVDDNSSSYGGIGVLALDWGQAADVQFRHLQVF